MSILPLSQNNPLLKDFGAKPEMTGRPEDGVLITRDGDAAIAGKENDKDRISEFGKIFDAKKADRERNDGAQKAGQERPAQELKKETGKAKADKAEKQPDVKTVSKAKTGEAKKTTTLKEILAALLEKKQSSSRTEEGREDHKIKREPQAMHLFTGRASTLRERLEHVQRKEGAVETVRNLLQRSHMEKKAKTAVIVDLRDTIEKKSSPVPSVAQPHVKKTAAKTAPVAAKKADTVREPVEVKVYARHPAGSDVIDASDRPRAEAPARPVVDFASRLSDAVKSEMVKHSGIILRNGGSGEIHLVLKPESLGSVRVKLNLEDTHIVGKIIVDNNTVREIIRQNLGDLETALQEKGYESASLNVFVAGEHKESADADQDFAALVEAGAEAEPDAAVTYEAGGVGMYDDALVNIVL